jgi:hypothetical protein
LATVAQAVATIAAVTDSKPGWVAHIARRLQEAGHLPTGSGSAPPTLQIKHIATFLLALLSGQPLKGVADAAEVYSDLRRYGFNVAVMPDSIRPPVFTARDYVEYVLHLFASGDTEGLGRLQLEVVSSWPELTIHFADGAAPWRFVTAGEPATHWRSPDVRKSTTITSQALHQIVRRLNLTR